MCVLCSVWWTNSALLLITFSYEAPILYFYYRVFLSVFYCNLVTFLLLTSSVMFKGPHLPLNHCL